MTPREAVLAWFEKNQLADVVQTDFMVFFAEKTEREAVWPMLGAPFVRGAGAALSALYKEGVLTRGRVGISAGPGFPKWVFVYEKWRP